MSSQNVPVLKKSRKLRDRFGAAWRCIKDDEPYKEYQAQIEALLEENSNIRRELSARVRYDKTKMEIARSVDSLQTEKARLEREVADLEAKKKELVIETDKAQYISGLYKSNMTKEKPDFKTNTEKFINAKLQELQGSIKVLQEIAQQNAEMSPEEKSRISVQLDILKSKFLATLMVYSETLNENEMATCKIGDKNVTLNALLNNLPVIFGWGIPINQQSQNTSQVELREINPQMKNSAVVKQTLTQEYADLLDGLHRLDILKGNTHDCVDYRYAGSTMNDGFSILLSKYCGIKAPYINTLKYSEPLRNFKMSRIPNPNVETILTSNTTDEISRTAKALEVSTTESENAR